jgi:hypothetical protein
VLAGAGGRNMGRARPDSPATPTHRIRVPRLAVGGAIGAGAPLKGDGQEQGVDVAAHDRQLLRGQP